MRYAVAVSQHHDPRVAAAEVAGQVLERLGPDPDVALLLASGGHCASMEMAASAVSMVVGPRQLVGASVAGVMANRQEVHAGPGLLLWAGHTGEVEVVRPSVGRPIAEPPPGSSILVLADAFSCDLPALLAGLPDHLPLAGGTTSPTGTGGHPVLLADGTRFDDGALLVVFPPGLSARSVLSHGCQRVGRLFTATAAGEGTLERMGGRTPLDRLDEILATDEVPPRQVREGLHLGMALADPADDPEARDFVVLPVLGTDRASGSVSVAGSVEVGTTVAFHVNRPGSAEQDLLARFRDMAAESVLMFAPPSPDRPPGAVDGGRAAAVCDGLSTNSVAGAACAAQVGRAGGRPVLYHSGTSALVLGNTGPDPAVEGGRT